MATEFKKGDIVTHREGNRFPGEFEVVRAYDGDAWYGTVSVVGRGDGRGYEFTPANLTVVPPRPQPEVPAIGSKVRVTYEGVVTEHNPLGGGFRIETDKGKSVFVGKRTHTIEVLERPFQIGTVARDAGDWGALPVIRTFEGQWHTHSGRPSRGVTDEKVRSGDYVILYEPATA